MREIKFRAWDTSKNEWIYVTLGDLVCGATSKPSAALGDGFKVADGDKTTSGEFLSWCQYTGLKDKNGKEIYEGDIFKTENDATGKVLWDRDGWVARIEDERWHGIRDESLGYAQEMSIEVIGNIYENPDLCK